MTKLEQIQLEVELEDLKALNINKDRIHEIEVKLGLVGESDIYNKNNVMIDEQISAFDEEGEPLQDKIETLDWDYKGYKDEAISIASQFGWNQTLISKLNEASNIIHKNTYRGGGSILTINPKVRPLLESFEYTHTNDDGELSIGARYRVIMDDNQPENKMTLSYDLSRDTKEGRMQSGPEKGVYKKFILMISPEERERMGSEDYVGQISLKLYDFTDPMSKIMIDEYINKCQVNIVIENYTHENAKIEQRELDARNERESRSTDVKDVIRNIQHDKIVKRLEESGLMHSNYRNETEVEAQTLDDSKTDEEVLSEYQEEFDSPMGMIFYFEKSGVETDTTLKGNLVAKQLTVDLRDTETTLQKMKEISSKQTFFKWAGNHTPIKNGFYDNLKTSGLLDRRLNVDYKSLLGMEKPKK